MPAEHWWCSREAFNVSQIYHLISDVTIRDLFDL